MRRDRVVGGVERIAEGAVTRQVSGQLTVFSHGRDFIEITAPAAEFVAGSGVRHGLLTVFCRHTSASLTIQENADPDVRTDLAAALDRLAPRDAGYVHGIEGPDDMPAHIRTMLTGSSLSIPVLDGRLALGTWQGIYLIEHRNEQHAREVIFIIIG